MRRRRRTVAGRDQDASAFSACLMRLCDAEGALGAALVDAEGETVDYAGTIEPFDIKIAAAEASILLEVLRHSRVPSWSDTEELRIRAAKRSFYVHVLGDGYAVVVLLPRHASGVSRRAVSEALRDLATESGLSPPRLVTASQERWARVDVRCAAKRRPEAIWVGGAWCALEVLGTYRADPSRRDVGYRARLETGAEITLVREPLGRWYADGLPQG